jgi:hypothetical protein
MEKTNQFRDTHVKFLTLNFYSVDRVANSKFKYRTRYKNCTQTHEIKNWVIEQKWHRKKENVKITRMLYLKD